MSTPEFLKLIRVHGVYGLAGYDGCRCAHFMVQGVSVDVHCHKSNSGVKWHGRGVIRVTGSGDLNMEDRAAIAEELLRLLTEKDWLDDEDRYWLVRFCGWDYDQDQLCVYCRKPRKDIEGYLCSQCLTATSPFGEKIADEYDFTRVEIRYPMLNSPRASS